MVEFIRAEAQNRYLYIRHKSGIHLEFINITVDFCEMYRCIEHCVKTDIFGLFYFNFLLVSHTTLTEIIEKFPLISLIQACSENSETDVEITQLIITCCFRVKYLI